MCFSASKSSTEAVMVVLPVVLVVQEEALE